MLIHHSFLWLNNSVVWLYHISLSIYQFMSVWVFYTLTIMNSAAINIHIQFFFNTCFQLFVYISRNGIPRSYCISMFNSDELPKCFPQQLHDITYPLAMYKDFNCTHHPQPLLYSIF